VKGVGERSERGRRKRKEGKAWGSTLRSQADGLSMRWGEIIPGAS